MKKLIVVFALCFVSAFCFSQTSQTMKTNSTKTIFCEILGHQLNPFKPNSITVTVDYGENYGNWKRFDNTVIKNEDGSLKKFNSMVDAMNYMGEQGWLFEQAYVVGAGNQNVYHWLLSKKINIDDK